MERRSKVLRIVRGSAAWKELKGQRALRNLRTLERCEMKNTKDMMRVVGIVLLSLFVLAVGVPLVLAAVGVTLSIFGFLAVVLIKVVVTLAIVYLVLVGIRTLLR
jgi:membrane protein YdbS with pleckstrin-like domain